MRHAVRFRLLFLGLVNGLIVLHVVLFYVFDKTSVGCIDFFGLATFLGNGEITAGTVFLLLIIVTTLILGRIFCGWGCHFALFQDFLSRFLGRIGLRVPFRRSRLEMILPPILFVVTLLYPILVWWRQRGLPRGITMNMGYPDVWHLLPGIKGVLLILLVDVVILSLLFGSRAFCRYVCPYGFFLKIFHALSPLRVVKSGDCSDCGSCMNACPTGVPIKDEIERFEVVHDLNCMNCGDCVAACPDGVLSLKTTKKAYANAFERIATGSSQPVWAESILFVAAIAGLFLYRGREYGDFLSVAMGLGAGAGVVIAIAPSRLVRPGWSRSLSKRRIRVIGGTTASYLVLGMIGQGVGSVFLEKGQRAFEAGDPESVVRWYSNGARMHRLFEPFTFYLDDFRDRAERRADNVFERADEVMKAEGWHDAELLYRTVLICQPDRAQAHGNLGTALLQQGQFWQAAQQYLKVLDRDPNDMVALYHLAMAWIQLGELDQASNIALRVLSQDTVGNTYYLMKQNPLFELLNRDPGFRRAMALYRPAEERNPLQGGDP